MVTTIIANYNFSKYIGESINACLNQTVPNKVVIIDDCSTDKSVEEIIKIIMPKQIETIHGMKIYKSENACLICLTKNGGPSIARNIGIGLTIKDTDYYNIVDADDIPHENKIERMLKEFKNNVGLVYGDYEIFNENTGLELREYKQPFSFEQLHKECIVHSNFMVSKECVLSVSDQNGFYNPQLRTAEDWDVELRIARRGWQIKHVPESLTKVRTHNNNSSSYRSKEEWQKNWNYIYSNYKL